ncbi:MAG: bifunctional sugar-1-phosphate nucleotidylyltransferase/acetyltransferase [Candidatus Kariarchaeaceae archaeon]|jgi:bifunctional UDP-N-acetylglucosamine pyrophosphorylase/glucosamine-1-phosphate N-acetyltransferase
MKGIILAAGHGEALKPITDEVSKPMIKILDKPLIQYAIERFSENGIKDIYIVIKSTSDQIQAYFGRGDKLGVEINYIVQDTDSGIDGAILAIESFIQNDEKFVLTHCDIIADPTLLTRTLNAVDNTGAEMGIAVALQSEIQDFGVVNLDSEGFIERVIPNGEPGEGNYVVAGTFLLTSKIFDYLSKGIPFNQCFNHFVNDGGEIAGGIWNESWIDVGRPWDILRANTYLLDRMRSTIINADAKIETNVQIIGPVVIESDVEILNGTVIKGPVFIGKGAFIGNNSLIRDYSVIGENAKIGMGVEVRSSLIMHEASIARLSYVGSSIVGPRATFHSGAITINQRRPLKPITTEIQGKQVLVPLEKFGAIVGPRSHVGEHTSLYPGTIVDTNAIIEPNVVIGGRIKAV